VARWGSGLVLGLLVGLLLNVVFLPLVGQGLFGQNAPLATAPAEVAQTLYGTAHAPLGLPVWLNMWLLGGIFSFVLVALLPWAQIAQAAPAPAAPGDGMMTRRHFGKVLGGTALALLGGGGVWLLTNGLLAATPASGVAPTAPSGPGTPVADSGETGVPAGNGTPPPAATPGVPASVAGTPLPPEFRGLQARLVPNIIPVEDFYITTKNYIDPVVDGNAWTLTVKGLVDQPFTLTLAELQALPAVEREETLACISNQVGGTLIGNARWRGVRLADLLRRAGPQAGAVDVVVRAAEGYSDSFALDAGLHNDCLVVYQMNGRPLVPKHGYPARLLVPNIYGMKNCKWLTGIELVNYDYKGYWQEQGWNDVAHYQIQSRIDYPDQATIPAQALYIGGVAFAGNRGIKRVEISTDGGRNWHDAALHPPANNTTWTFWTDPWLPTAGSYTLVVRATDGTGALQTAQKQDTFPNGATGYHTLPVRVG